MVTLRDIAECCRVAVGTVSFALRDDPRVRPETRERIQAIAQEMGYNAAVSEHARRLRLRGCGQQTRSDSIAVFCHDQITRERYQTRIYEGILEEMSAQPVSLVTVMFKRNQPFTLPRIFHRGDIDGIIFSPGLRDFFAAARTWFDQHPMLHAIPTVKIIAGDPGDHLISLDTQHAAYLATQHLLQLGHRHVLYFYMNDIHEQLSHRMDGVTAALCEHGLDPDAHLHVFQTPFAWIHPQNAAALTATNGQLNVEGANALVAFLEDHANVTGLIAINDANAVHAWYTLRRCGKSIPQDYSLVGFDDTDPFPDEYGNNLLTTVSTPLEEVGKTAVRTLLHLVDHPNEAPATVTVPVSRLCVRQSTSSPRHDTNL